MTLDERPRKRVEVEGHADLEALVALVEREGSCELTRDGRTVARVGGVRQEAASLPTNASSRTLGWKPTAQELAVVESAFGAWEGLIDGDELIARIRADREASPVRHLDVDAAE